MQIFIIPYQELLGNYDSIFTVLSNAGIIPYQELLGNYDGRRQHLVAEQIIPYQELLGNYDEGAVDGVDALHYTIPRAIREL